VGEWDKKVLILSSCWLDLSENLSKVTPPWHGRHDTQNNDIQHNDILQNDTEHNDIQRKNMICGITILNTAQF
jgi:hypothetical protein